MGEPAYTQEVALLDPTYYPTTDDMGQDALQALIVELLRPLLARYLAQQGIKAYVGTDQFIYWVQHAPTISVAPDVYVMPGLSPDLRPRSWKLWEAGVVPTFALEVMAAENTAKDRVLSPRRYNELGVRELIVFDPYAERRRAPVRFSAYRREGKGELELAETNNGDRIRSTELGIYIRVVGEEDDPRLRIGTGPKGRILFPTEAEEQANRVVQERVRVEQERVRTERMRARAEQEHIRAETERARAEQAEAELARLRAMIERLPRS